MCIEGIVNGDVFRNFATRVELDLWKAGGAEFRAPVLNLNIFEFGAEAIEFVENLLITISSQFFVRIVN